MTTTFNYGGTNSAPYPTRPYWLMSITDPRGQPTTYTRDASNRPTQISYPDGTYETFTYNGFGQVLTHRKTDASVYTYTYDGAGNLTTSTDSLNSQANLYTHYYYDGLDRLSQVNDYTATTPGMATTVAIRL